MKHLMTCLALIVTLSVLAACGALPTALEPIQNPRAEFKVDPQTQTVTPVVSNTTSLQTQGNGNRRLVQGVDVRFTDPSFYFESPDKLVVQLRVQNITENLDFTQPFFFTLSSPQNIAEASAPLVTATQLGGDGVLSTGETSELFTFRVVFEENELFSFFVDVNAVVVERTICTNPVAVPDENLAAALRTATNTEGDLSCEALEILREFDASFASISNLEGLQFAVNLLDLNLSDNEIGDIEVLASLTQLINLNLGDSDFSLLNPTPKNFITDVTPLAGLRSLETLDLSFNSLSDVSPLESLSGLTELNLSANTFRTEERIAALTNISPLETLSNLNVLKLNDNEIRDISALVTNSGLDAGDMLELIDNPLSAQALEDVETLKERGVSVSLER